VARRRGHSRAALAGTGRRHRARRLARQLAAGRRRGAARVRLRAVRAAQGLEDRPAQGRRDRPRPAYRQGGPHRADSSPCPAAARRPLVRVRIDAGPAHRARRHGPAVATGAHPPVHEGPGAHRQLGPRGRQRPPGSGRRPGRGSGGRPRVLRRRRARPPSLPRGVRHPRHAVAPGPGGGAGLRVERRTGGRAVPVGAPAPRAPADAPRGGGPPGAVACRRLVGGHGPPPGCRRCRPLRGAWNAPVRDGGRVGAHGPAPGRQRLVPADRVGAAVPDQGGGPLVSGDGRAAAQAPPQSPRPPPPVRAQRRPRRRRRAAGSAGRAGSLRGLGGPPPAGPGVVRRPGAGRGHGCLGPQGGEQHDVADVVGVGEQHDESVHADAQATGRG
jgi:hypothetical protein